MHIMFPIRPQIHNCLFIHNINTTALHQMLPSTSCLSWLLSFAFILLTPFIASSQTYEVIWNPIAWGDTSGALPMSLYPGQPGDKLITSLIKSHVSGEMTLYRDLHKTDPYPRNLDSLWPGLAKMLEFSNKAVPKQLPDNWEAYFVDQYLPADFLIHEQWIIQGDQIDFKLLGISIFFENYTSHNLATGVTWVTEWDWHDIPEAIYNLQRSASALGEETLLSAIQDRRLSIKIQGIKPKVPESEWILREQQYNPVWQDSLLTAWHYADQVTPPAELANRHQTRTQLRYDLMIGTTNAVPDLAYEQTFPQSAHQQTQVFLDAILPNLVEDIFSGNISTLYTHPGEKIDVDGARRLADQIWEEAISNRTHSYDSYKPDLASLSSSCVISGRLQRDENGVSYRPDTLLLYWQDETGIQHPWVQLPVAGLNKERYSINGTRLPEWLKKGAYAAYPITINDEPMRDFSLAVLYKRLLEGDNWPSMPPFTTVLWETDEEFARLDAYWDSLPQNITQGLRAY